jgi:hypothetical protein
MPRWQCVVWKTWQDCGSSPSPRREVFLPAASVSGFGFCFYLSESLFITYP